MQGTSKLGAGCWLFPDAAARRTAGFYRQSPLCLAKTGWIASCSRDRVWLSVS